MKKISINLIAGDKQKDAFMHAADMFEAFKRYGEIMCIEDYELQKSEPDLAFLERFKKLLEDANYIVTAIWIAQMPEVNIIDWSVKVFSDGHKWAVMDDYLKNFGIIRPEAKPEPQ